MNNRKASVAGIVVSLTLLTVSPGSGQSVAGSFQSTTLDSPTRAASLNDLVIAAVHAMPQGGQYAADHRAFVALNQAVGTDGDGRLQLRPELARPVFCSGATYLVLLAVIDRLNREGRLPLSPDTVAALQVRMQPDGVGVWGRWNANGPGTARLFSETQLGENFTSFAEGKPGDFLKIWWNDSIGAKEHGHSVVYLGTSVSPTGVEMVNFWSGNVPDGLGFKSVPKTRVHRVLFSRLENPRALARVMEIPARDEYLAGLLKRGSSEQEMCTMVSATLSIPERRTLTR